MIWFLVLGGVLVGYICILRWNEGRPELVVIPDPLFKYLPLYDTSIPVNFILYLSSVMVALHIKELDPTLSCKTWILLMLVRTLVLWLHPFQGCPYMKPLRDPILDFIIGFHQDPLRNDCSFSGHCSTLVTFGLLLPAQQLFFFSAAFITSILLILSRVHYSADCLIAPMAALFCFRMAAFNLG